MALSLLDQFGPAQRQAAGAAVGMNTQPGQKPMTDTLPASMGPQRPTSNQPLFGSLQAQQYGQQNAAQLQQSLNDTAAQNAKLHEAYQDPSKNPAAAFQRIIGTSEDFYNQQSGESAMDRMLREQLMQRASGQNQPYDATTIGALKTGANEQAAQAQMVNDQRAQANLAERGFKPGDPGYQAAMARSQLQRQQSNQQAALGINQQANLANYTAQGQALAQAGGYTNDQYNRQAGALDRLQKNYNQVSVNDLGTAKRYQVPSYADYMKGKQ